MEDLAGLVLQQMRLTDGTGQFCLVFSEHGSGRWAARSVDVRVDGSTGVGVDRHARGGRGDGALAGGAPERSLQRERVCGSGGSSLRQFFYIANTTLFSFPFSCPAILHFRVQSSEFIRAYTTANRL